MNPYKIQIQFIFTYLLNRDLYNKKILRTNFMNLLNKSFIEHRYG